MSTSVMSINIIINLIFSEAENRCYKQQSIKYLHSPSLNVHILVVQLIQKTPNAQRLTANLCSLFTIFPAMKHAATDVLC